MKDTESRTGRHLKAERLRRLSDEYTDSSSARETSNRIRNAGKDLGNEENPAKAKDPKGQEQVDLESKGQVGDPGADAGDPDATTEEGVVEPPEPKRLTDAELAMHPDEFLQTVSEEGEESETEDGTDSEDGDEPSEGTDEDRKSVKDEEASDAHDPLSKEQEEEIKKGMSASKARENREED